MIFKISKKYFNDLHLGLCFTILFTAFNGQSHIQQTVTDSIHQDNPNYYADGFATLGIIYSTFALCTWLAPYLISVIGCRMALAFGSLCYFTYVTFDYFENSWSTYASGAITGFGAAFLWTAQGTYFVLNSELGSLHPSICIFILFFQASEFTGNIFIYCLFNDPDQPIDRSMRTKIEIFLGAFILCSSVLLATLRPPIGAKDGKAEQTTFWNEIKKTFKTLSDKQMLLSVLILVFCGLLVSFLTVLPASLGFSKYLSINSKKFAPLSGLMHGCGEIIGICLAWLMNAKSKYKFYLLPTACICSLIALCTVSMGLPNSSVSTDTDERPVVEMSLYIFLVANTLLAMADAILLVETFNIVGNINPTDSAPPFAMSNFIKYIASTISYFYGSYFRFHVQVLILMFFASSTFLVHCGIWRSNSLRNIQISKNEACRQRDQKERYIAY